MFAPEVESMILTAERLCQSVFELLKLLELNGFNKYLASEFLMQPMFVTSSITTSSPTNNRCQQPLEHEL